MDKIILTFESLSPQVNFIVKLNNIKIDYHIQNDSIIIDSPIQIGTNNLSLKTSENINDTIKLIDVIINGVNLRQVMYLAYSTHNNGTNFCNTWFTNDINQITLPFGYPISNWLGECHKKIPNRSYGTNLYEKYDIYYPESVKIKDSFPKLMQDFMLYDFGFTAINKHQPIKGNKLVPWIPIDFEYDEASLFNEFNNNIELIKNNFYNPKQNYYNAKESKNVSDWIVAMAVHSDIDNQTKTDDKLKEEFDRKKLPLFCDLLDRITNMNIKILHAFIGIVESGSYVAPHCDDTYKYENFYKNTSGASQFFIPIGWKPGNLFKFNNVGFIPWERGPHLVNNSDYMHGSINDSSDIRFTIGIYCDFTEKNIQDLKTVLI
jgi:hypothetical protein